MCSQKCTIFSASEVGILWTMRTKSTTWLMKSERPTRCEHPPGHGSRHHKCSRMDPCRDRKPGWLIIRYYLPNSINSSLLSLTTQISGCQHRASSSVADGLANWSALKKNSRSSIFYALLNRVSSDEALRLQQVLAPPADGALVSRVESQALEDSAAHGSYQIRPEQIQFCDIRFAALPNSLSRRKPPGCHL